MEGGEEGERKNGHFPSGGPLNIESFTWSVFSMEWRNATAWIKATPRTSQQL